MTVQEYYDSHLAYFYSWMIGGFYSNQAEFDLFLRHHDITPVSTQTALDLGAGNGIQSVSLAKLGFKVTAIDFSKKLLSELHNHSNGLSIEVTEDDFRHVSQYKNLVPELILCWGDSLTHLESKSEIAQLIFDCTTILSPGGKLILSFRDYSKELSGSNRFIPVKCEEDRILTCIMEYHPESITVTDLLYEKEKSRWHQKVSSYNKTRISPAEVITQLEENCLEIIYSGVVNGMTTLIATKESNLTPGRPFRKSSFLIPKQTT